MENENNRATLQDVYTEEAVLGLVLMKGEDVADLLVEKLVEDDFTMQENRMIFTTIRDMFLTGHTRFDEISVGQKLLENGQSEKVGGKIRLTHLQTAVPYPIPGRKEFEGYIEILKEKTLRRNMFQAGVELGKAACSLDIKPMDGISLAERTLLVLSEDTEGKTLDAATTFQNSLKLALDMYNGEPPEGSIKTGIGGLDDILSSINPSDFVIIGARPSMGKTAFAANILENVALEQGKFVAFYSLEMSSEQIGLRMLFSRSGISSEKIRHGDMEEDDFLLLEDAAENLKTAPVIIDDRAPLDIASIVSRTRKLKAEKNLGLVIIDYLQLMTGIRGSDGRQQEVSDISRSLKLLAKELHIPIIALSQLNRSVEMRTDKRPQMSDLRESGSLEQDADIVIFLYRDEYYHPDTEEKNVTEAIVSKHRNGKLGTVKMFFNKETSHFYDLLQPEGNGVMPPPERQKELFSEDESAMRQAPKEAAGSSKVANEQRPREDSQADDGPPTVCGDEFVCI